MMPVVTAAQMRSLDEETIRGIGVPGRVLMENAGRGVVERLLELARAGIIDLDAGQAVVLAGPGNNGGDGMVIARYLHNRGTRTRLLVCAARERVKGDALANLKAAQACGVAPEFFPEDARPIDAALAGLGRTDVIVDALLGTGLVRAIPADGMLGRVIEAANRSAAVRVAVDLPSGLDADRGVPLGEDGRPAGDRTIVRADHTVTFGFPKIGMVGAPGFVYTGTLRVVDIGIPESLCGREGVRARLLDPSCLRPLSGARDPLGHKGTHGHLLVLAGSMGKTGAALLCARGALRVGVGLCTIAVPAAAQASLSGQVLEAMTAAYEPAAAAEELPALAAGKRALAVGPGLPVEKPEPLRRALLRLAGEEELPLVLDAEALNLLAGLVEVLRRPASKVPVVLTPHPGEAARMLGRSTAEIQADRVRSAVQLCERSGAVVVLKGARTLIAAPAEGGPELAIVPTGNAGMGSGGMGDVLCGMIGALLTAGYAPYAAACIGAYWHGLAGDLLLSRSPPGSILAAGELCDTLAEARACTSI